MQTLAAELEKMLQSASMKAVRDHVQAVLDPGQPLTMISLEILVAIVSAKTLSKVFWGRNFNLVAVKWGGGMLNV